MPPSPWSLTQGKEQLVSEAELANNKNRSRFVCLYMCLCVFLFCFVGLICLCCPWIPCLRMWAVWEGDTPVSGALWYDPYLSQRGAMVNYLTLHDESLTCIKTFQGVVSQSHQIFWHPPQTEGQGSAWVTCLLAQREPEHHTRLTHDKDKENNDEKKKKSL